MPVVTHDGRAIQLDKIWAYADRKVNRELVSGIFQRVPLLAYLAGKTRTQETPLRPDSLGLLGGPRNMNEIAQARERAIEVHQRILIDRTGGVKMLGERDTTPSTGNTSQDQNVKTAIWRYSGVLSAPIKVWNETLRNSTGDMQIASAMDEATDQAEEELLDDLAYRLWWGSPADQSSNIWSDVLGVIHAMNDDNTYGNLDRSTTTLTAPSNTASSITNYWAGIRDTTARQASLQLVDTSMYKLSTPLYLRNNRTPDLWLCGGSVFHTIKQEALDRGGASVTEDIPEFASLGVRFDAVRYGGATWVADPTLTGDQSSVDADITDATKVVAGFFTDDWVFSTHPSENFRTTQFVDQGESKPGGDDAVTAEIRAKVRMHNRRPWRSVLFTNISA